MKLEKNGIEISFKDIYRTEKDIGLYNIKKNGISLWRIFRFYSRKKLLDNMGQTSKTRIDKVNLKKNLLSTLRSFLGLINLVFKKNKKVDNIIFAFPRLYNINGLYMDRFTDPIISQSDLKENFLIFQRAHGGSHYNPRCNRKNTVTLDFIVVTSLLLAIVLLPYLFIFHSKKINLLFKSASKYFELSFNDLIKWYILYGQFVVSKKIYTIIFKKISPQRIFIVDREIFTPAIVASKKCNAMVYELQHGITHDDSMLYTGEYDELIDPDFFLVFGDKCIGEQYAVPIEKIINIGWAYKSWLLNLEYKQFSNNVILIASQPEISTQIIEITRDLAIKYPLHIFHIRLHPQEQLNENQLQLISDLNNVFIVDNAKESFHAILSYKTVIGENSTLLYEAMSLGKKVGRIAFHPLTPISNEKINGGSYLYSLDDFEEFMKSEEIITSIKNYYSEFDKKIINSLK